MASLYERLGGEPAVNVAVERFYRRMLSDERVADYFDGVDMDRQMAKQKAFLTMVFGGPANYSGKDMRAAHRCAGSPCAGRRARRSRTTPVAGRCPSARCKRRPIERCAAAAQATRRLGPEPARVRTTRPLPSPARRRALRMSLCRSFIGKTRPSRPSPGRAPWMPCSTRVL